MKSILVTLLAVIITVSTVFGGGNTSVVHLSEVNSVKVEPAKITIIGTGYVECRIITDKEPAESSVYGQPAQLLRARTTHGTFEIIPYFSDPEIAGIPTGGHQEAELKKLSAQWWEEMRSRFANVRVGDSVTIGYQQDRITISDFRIQRIIGAGSLTINPKPAPTKPTDAASPVKTDK